jgi:hypothetical protein
MYHSARDNSQISSHIADRRWRHSVRLCEENLGPEINCMGAFYQRHPKAAEKNPLSVHAGTDRSIRLGAFMWRVVGLCILLNGLIRLR